MTLFKTIDNRIDNLDIVIVIVHFGSYTNMLEEIGHLDKIRHHQKIKVQFMARQDKGRDGLRFRVQSAKANNIYIRATDVA